MPPCEETNVRGEPCGAPEAVVDPETGLCPAHDPDNRQKFQEGARKGGEAVRRAWKSRRGLADEDLPPLKTPADAERWLEAAGRAVATGRLGHNEGRAVVRAVREWLRAHEAGEVAEKVEELRKSLERVKRRGGLEVVK